VFHGSSAVNGNAILDSVRPGQETPGSNNKHCGNSPQAALEEHIINTSFFAKALALIAPLLLALPAASQSSSTGRNLAAACANCHGTNGVSTGGMPPLAGQPRQYLVQTLKDFRDGRRPGTIMPQLAKGYADAQIEALSDYLAMQKAGQ